MPEEEKIADGDSRLPVAEPEWSTEDNGAFLTRQLAVYLRRLFHRQSPSPDRETLEFTCFVLGSAGAGRLCDFMEEHLPASLSCRFREQIDEADDMDDVGQSLAGFLQKRKSVRRKFEKALKAELKNRISDLEREGTSRIETNIETVADIFGLAPDERALLLFLLILAMFDEADYYFMTHLHCDKPFFRQNLTKLIDIDHDRLGDVLYGRLHRLEMISVGSGDLSLNSGLIEILENPEKALTSSSSFIPIPDPGLPLDAHLVGPGHTRILKKLLHEKPDTSTHILLYGPPGTGKSSYARALAAEMSAPAYEIVNNEQNSSILRRVAILSCIHFTNGGDGSIIVADEADNLLNTRSSWFEAGETRDKGWVNHLLEEKGLRMIWIVNRLAMDDSIYRRFAYSIQFHPFTRKQRISVWKTVLARYGKGRMLPPNEIETLAGRYEASAGGIDLAVRKAVEAGIKGRKSFLNFLEKVMVSHLTLMNGGGKPPRPPGADAGFLVDGLNVRADLPALIGDVRTYDAYWRRHLMGERPSLNMLFYGPPGTGKSETAKYLAQVVDRDLMLCSASDILDMYVGGTEKNLADLFSRAEDRGAVLLIDEADSFLQERDSALRSWEVTQTNEFLTQLENFRGILVCTTNRLPKLDSAASRRFNRKIGFDYLTADGKLLFYEKLLGPYTPQQMDDPEKRRLWAIPQLTPGDFKVVRNQHFLDAAQGRLSHGELIGALEAESRVKVQREGRAVAGFTESPKPIDRIISAR